MEFEEVILFQSPPNGKEEPIVVKEEKVASIVSPSDDIKIAANGLEIEIVQTPIANGLENEDHNNHLLPIKPSVKSDNGETITTNNSTDAPFPLHQIDPLASSPAIETLNPSNGAEATLSITPEINLDSNKQTIALGTSSSTNALPISPLRSKTIIMHAQKSQPAPTWIPLKSCMQRYCEPFFVAVERWRTTENENLLINRVHIVDTMMNLYEQFSQSSVSYVFNLQYDRQLNEGENELLPEVIPSAGKEYCTNGDKKAFEASRSFVPPYLFHRIGVYFQSLLRLMAGKNDTYLKSSNPTVRKGIENCIKKLLRLPDSVGMIHIVYKIIDKDFSEMTDTDFSEIGCNFIYPVNELSASANTFLSSLMNSRPEHIQSQEEGSFLKENPNIKKIKLKNEKMDTGNGYSMRKKEATDEVEESSSGEELLYVTTPRKPINRQSENKLQMVRFAGTGGKQPKQNTKAAAAKFKASGKSPRHLLHMKSLNEVAKKDSMINSRSRHQKRKEDYNSSEEEEEEEEESEEEEEVKAKSSRSAKSKSKPIPAPAPAPAPAPKKTTRGGGRMRAQTSTRKKRRKSSSSSSSSSLNDVIGTKVATYLFVPNSETKTTPPEVRLYTGEIVDVIPPTKPNAKDEKYIAKWYDDKDQEEYILDLKAFQNSVDLYKVNCSWTVKHESIGLKVADYFYIPGIVNGETGAQKVFVGKVSKYCAASSSKSRDQLYHIVWEDGDEQDYDEMDFQKGRKTYESLQKTKKLQKEDDLPLTEDDEESLNRKKRLQSKESSPLKADADANEEESENDQKAISHHTRRWLLNHPIVFTKVAKAKKGRAGKLYNEDNYLTGIVVKYSPETYPGGNNQKYLVKWDGSAGKEVILNEEEYQEGISNSNKMFLERLKTMPFLPGLEVYNGKKVKEEFSDEEQKEKNGKKTRRRKAKEDVIPSPPPPVKRSRRVHLSDPPVHNLLKETMSFHDARRELVIEDEIIEVVEETVIIEPSDEEQESNGTTAHNINDNSEPLAKEFISESMPVMITAEDIAMDVVNELEINKQQLQGEVYEVLNPVEMVEVQKPDSFEEAEMDEATLAGSSKHISPEEQKENNGHDEHTNDVHENGEDEQTTNHITGYNEDDAIQEFIMVQNTRYEPSPSFDTERTLSNNSPDEKEEEQEEPKEENDYFVKEE